MPFYVSCYFHFQCIGLSSQWRHSLNFPINYVHFSFELLLIQLLLTGIEFGLHFDGQDFIWIDIWLKKKSLFNSVVHMDFSGSKWDQGVHRDQVHPSNNIMKQ
jgi:hypothetical protein